MAQVTDDAIRNLVEKLWGEVYELPFRGKKRGRFTFTRDQMKLALGTQKLHDTAILRVQDEALDRGLVITDLDDVFGCIETDVVRKYRQLPRALFEDVFKISVGPERDDSGDDEAVEDE